MTLRDLQLKALINESAKTALWESSSVKKVVLESRLVQIKETLDLNEADWIDRARNWLRNKVLGVEDAVKQTAKNTLINPEKIIGDEQQAMGVVLKSLQTAKKRVSTFKQDALRSSSAINNLSDAVLDAFGKYINLVDNIPMNKRGLVEREVMQLVSEFYIALMEEKKRIETYLSYLAKEVGSQGYDLGKSSSAMASYKPEKAPRNPQAATTPALSGKLAGARA